MRNVNVLEFLNSNIEKYTKEQNHKMLVSFRNIKSEYIYEKEKTKNSDIDILRKMFNKRLEASNIYKDVNQNLYEDETREMSIIHPFLPPELSKKQVLDFLNSLSISKEKKNFKLFQNECESNFGQKVDSKIILEYLNS